MTPPPVLLLRRGDSGPAVADVLRAAGADRRPAERAWQPVWSATALAVVPSSTSGSSRPSSRSSSGVASSSTASSAVDVRRPRRGPLDTRGPGAALHPRPLHRGRRRRSAQARLVELGFTPGKVDGIHGPDTDAALRAFQVGGRPGPRRYGRPRDDAGVRACAVGERGVANALREREHIRRGGYSLGGRTIVLDPGHGGADAGRSRPRPRRGRARAATSPRRIEGRAQRHGVSVVFTRTDRTSGGPDEERAAFANSCDADLVLSLHTDHADTAAAQRRRDVLLRTPRQRPGRWSVIGEHFADLLLREVVARTGLTDCRTHARSWTLLDAPACRRCASMSAISAMPDDAATLADPHTFGPDRGGQSSVALQRLYLGEADTAQTGVLKLSDLRRHLDAMRTGGTPPPNA